MQGPNLNGAWDGGIDLFNTVALYKTPALKKMTRLEMTSKRLIPRQLMRFVSTSY
jgi:hypothetical protein